MRYKINDIITSNNCGNGRVLGREKGKLLIEFFSDKTVVKVLTENAKRGAFDNPNKPSVYGVGYRGVGEHKTGDGKGKHNVFYKVWNQMLKRCYNKDYLKRFPTYEGCYVNDRWLNYQNFCEDIKQLENYENFIKFGNKEWNLDKDIKFKGNKEYSKEKCKFVYYKDNIADAASRRIYTKETIDKMSEVKRLPIEYYSEKSTNRTHFKKKCNREGYNFEDFEETLDYRKDKIYYFFYKTIY